VGGFGSTHQYFLSKCNGARSRLGQPKPGNRSDFRSPLYNSGPVPGTKIFTSKALIEEQSQPNVPTLVSHIDQHIINEILRERPNEHHTSPILWKNEGPFFTGTTIGGIHGRQEWTRNANTRLWVKNVICKCRTGETGSPSGNVAGVGSQVYSVCCIGRDAIYCRIARR